MDVMRVPRFSIRWLLVLTALVAMLLYVLYLRPTVVARNYVQQMQMAAKGDLSGVSRQYFNNMNIEGAKLDARLQPRSWPHVFKCQQLFTINMALPVPGKSGEWIVGVRDYCATPLGVQELGRPYIEARELRAPATSPAV